VKAETNLLHLLSISTRGLLRQRTCLRVSLLIDNWYLLWKPLVIKLIEAQAINLKDGYHYGDYKRTWQGCYELKSLELDNRTTLVLSNTRELNRELFYKLVYLI